MFNRELLKWGARDRDVVVDLAIELVPVDGTDSIGPERVAIPRGGTGGVVLLEVRGSRQFRD